MADGAILTFFIAVVIHKRQSICGRGAGGGAADYFSSTDLTTAPNSETLYGFAITALKPYFE